MNTDIITKIEVNQPHGLVYFMTTDGRSVMAMRIEILPSLIDLLQQVVDIAEITGACEGEGDCTYDNC